MKVNIDTFELENRICRVYRGAGNENKISRVIVQAVDKEWIVGEAQEEKATAAVREDTLGAEAESILSGNDSVIFANFAVEHWNDELSPWSADAVFKNQPFAGGAESTLKFVTDAFIPELRARYELLSDVKIIIGGYSLAGLFALWASYMTDIFHAIAAVSPSVWFPGWIDFASQKQSQAKKVYLSLGDREEKTNNQVMARVGDNIRRQKEILDMQGTESVLEWNEGNHFRDVEKRVARGMLWTRN